MRLVIQRVKEASVTIDGKVVSAIGQLLAVSQFTLTSSTKKGNRPSYIRAAGHELAVPLYDKFCVRLSEMRAGRCRKAFSEQICNALSLMTAR